MHHCMRDFDTGGEPVDDDAAGFALEDGEKLLRERNVLIGQMKRRGELAVKMASGGEKFVDTAALDEESSGAEDFFQKI